MARLSREVTHAVLADMPQLVDSDDFDDDWWMLEPGKLHCRSRDACVAGDQTLDTEPAVAATLCM